MDEDLRTWKIHFNICDAAHFALQNILTHHGILLGDVQSGPANEQSIQREIPSYSEGLTDHDWTFYTAQAEGLLPNPSVIGNSQINNVSEHVSSPAIP